MSLLPLEVSVPFIGSHRLSGFWSRRSRRGRATLIQEDDHALMELVQRNLWPQDPKDCQVYYDTAIEDAGES
jgi:hypothetical protein